MVSLMALKSKREREDVLNPATPLVVSPPVPTLEALEALEVVSPMTLNLKSEQVTREGSDSDSDVAACPTTTNSLKPTRPTTNTGQNSPKTSPRPTKTNVAEMPSRPGMRAEKSTCPMPHPLVRPSHRRRVPHVSAALL
jgi:hypothetical protein